MIFSCDVLSCSNSPKYYCKCNAQNRFLCSNHALQHLDDHEGSDHSLRSMFSPIPQEKKNYY